MIPEHSNWIFVSFDTSTAYFDRNFKHSDLSDTGTHRLFVYSVSMGKENSEDKIREIVRQSIQGSLAIECFFVSTLRSFIERILREQVANTLIPTQADKTQIKVWIDCFRSASDENIKDIRYRQLYKLQSQSRKLASFSELSEAENLLIDILLREFNTDVLKEVFRVTTDHQSITALDVIGSNHSIDISDLFLTPRSLLKMAQLKFIELYSDPPTIRLTSKVAL